MEIERSDGTLKTKTQCDSLYNDRIFDFFKGNPLLFIEKSKLVFKIYRNSILIENNLRMDLDKKVEDIKTKLLLYP